MTSVIVFYSEDFCSEDAESNQQVEIYAVPDDWDSDDCERFITEHSSEWTMATVTDVKPIPADAL